MTQAINYARRFQDSEAVAAYEHTEYGAGSYSSQTWRWQRPVLEGILRDYARERQAPLRLLDFACGTGRVLASVESLVAVAEGVDISENMVALARAKCPKARLKVGDILSQTGLLENEYDVITAFRFLLNVEPDVRRRVLCRLREVLRRPDGLLLLNVHGNSRSLRHPAILWRRRREAVRPTGAMLNEMSPGETNALLRECGFRVVRQLGFGMLPPTLYRTPVRWLAARLDYWMAGEKPWCNYAVDLMFVCQPR